MISDKFISSIYKAFLHICDLDISSMPTDFGFYIVFINTKFLLDFASNFKA